MHPFNPQALASDRVDLIGAYHTSDVPYWFGTLDAFNMFRTTRLWQAADRQLSQTMTSLLIAFANTGVPSAAGVMWPAWSSSSEQLLEFGASGVAARPIDGARVDFVATTAGQWPAATPRAITIRD